MSDTERLAIELFGWRWTAFDGTPIRGTDGYPQKMRVRRLLSPEGRKQYEQSEHVLGVSDAAGDEPLAYAYCSSGGGPLLPECLAYGDDAGVLYQARKVWRRRSPQWKAFVGALPACCDYQLGDFAKAAIAALDATRTGST